MDVFSPQIVNPFGVPVYYRDTVTSTMDEARVLAAGGAEHGTVITADYQSSGRGRSSRAWIMNRGENLSFTVILRYKILEEVPPCLTLKAGLALSFAIEDFAPALRGAVQVKWPNDIMLLQKNGRGRKTAGILTEAVGGTVFLGVGINAAQTAFPPELSDKATSISLTLYGGLDDSVFRRKTAALTERRFILLEAVLSRLCEELELSGREPGTKQGPEQGPDTGWRERLETRLYMKGRRIQFIPGAPAECIAGKESLPKDRLIRGILQGIGENGEIRIIPENEPVTNGGVLPFVTGELLVYE